MKTSAVATTESVWRARVREWRESGQSATDFAKGRGYAPSTLRYYSSQLQRQDQTRFVRLVSKTPEATAAPDLVVEVGSARVRVASGFDTALLCAVVRALEAGAK